MTPCYIHLIDAAAQSRIAKESIGKLLDCFEGREIAKSTPWSDLVMQDQVKSDEKAMNAGSQKNRFNMSERCCLDDPIGSMVASIAAFSGMVDWIAIW